MEDTIQITIVDDDEDDRFLVSTAIKEFCPQSQISMAGDGFMFMELLEADERLPSLILLDLNLPVKDGFQLLTEMRKDERFTSIPIVVFSTSDSPHDVKEAYRLGANSFITKPQSYQGLKGVIQSFCTYWMKTAQIPTV